MPGVSVYCNQMNLRNKMIYPLHQQATNKINSPVLATLFYCCLPNLLYSFAIAFIITAHLMRPWSLEPDGAVS